MVDLQEREGVFLRQSCWLAWDDLCIEARALGFDPRIASAYRSVDRQLAIWNAKARGLRPVLDSLGRAIDISSLDDEALMHAILRWSALPGASRHHWGTDFDIYDASALPAGGGFDLLLSECEPGGLFADFYAWLADWLASDPRFYRPYAQDLGGVAPEPWHLSLRSEASVCLQQLDGAELREFIQCTDIALKPAILANFEHILERYVYRVEAA